MKVRYVVSNLSIDKILELGKEYEVLVDGKHYYTIIVSDKKVNTFAKERFEKVVE